MLRFKIRYPFSCRFHAALRYGVSGNRRSLRRYVYVVGRLLFKWLNRRSQRRSANWERFDPVLERLLPTPCIVYNLYPVSMRRTQAGSQMV